MAEGFIKIVQIIVLITVNLLLLQLNIRCVNNGVCNNLNLGYEE